MAAASSSLGSMLASNVTSTNTVASAIVSPSLIVSLGDVDPRDAAGILATFGKLLWLLLGIAPGLILGTITFTTITLPTWLFTLFSMSLTFTMNATTLLIILLAAVSLVSYFIRYRFLNVYSRLPQEPQRTEPQVELFPETQDGSSKPGLSNYLDEFLEAIKVFGYLERPVFHELTRTMQTRKLMAGETLLLEEEKGFCLVVDGLVQIFVKSQRNTGSSGDRWDLFEEDAEYSEGHQGYQLLTEVKNGASMSSLFSILSLFTEDVRLRYDDATPPASAFGLGFSQTPGTTPSTPLFSGTPLQSSQHELNGMASENDRLKTLPKVPPLSLGAAFDDQKGPNVGTGNHGSSQQKSVHPDIVARAMVDTTIAIIPASAFRRLTRVYPKATAHIVQVILTRLQRVTLSTAHQYLGLTTSVLQIEKMMNKFTSYDLPNHLRGDALDRLKDKFVKERDRIGLEEGSEGIALHNPGRGSRRRSSTSLRKDAVLSSRLAAARGISVTPDPAGTVAQPINPDVSAGDLAGSIPSRLSNRAGSLSLKGSAWEAAMNQPIQFRRDPRTPLSSREQNPFRPSFDNSPLHRQESITEDAVFRESILDCMAKALGLDMHAMLAARRGGPSVEQSPRLVSYDVKRQTAVFNNAFGFIGPFEGSGDGDADSVMSSSPSVSGTLSGRSLHDELIDDIEILFFPKGSVLVEQGERNPGVYYVIDGFLDVSILVDDKEDRKAAADRGNMPPRMREDSTVPVRRRAMLSRAPSMHPSISQDPRKQVSKSLFLVKPGGIAGYIGTLSAYRSFTDVTAKTDVYVGFLPRASLERVAEKYPVVLLTMAKRLTSLLPRLILHIDFALEWVQVNAGQVIYHQGEESDAIYIVLNGRLRAIKESEEGGMRVTAEYGQGESVGELEVMTESPRPASLHAIRDTELCKFPRTLFNSLAQEHPDITIQVAKLIAQRMRALVENRTDEGMKAQKRVALSNSSTSTLNLRTIAILPVTGGVPVVDFGNRLMSALSQIGVPSGVTQLNQAIVLNHLGRHAFSRMGRLKLSQYLADLEERYGMVLYVADTSVNAPWTQTCITQADSILLVAIAGSSPAIGEYERLLLGMKTTARKELVLLHHERYSYPGLTRKWLSNRVWINGGHHHIHMTFRNNSTTTPHSPSNKLGTAIRQRVQVLQAEIQKYTSRRVRQQPLYSNDTPFKGDLHRLARRLCGRSVGLVLGGGGARGIAHVGVIRALEEAGIPVDIVGGTSIGAFIGALYARDADVVPMLGRAKKFSGRMASMWRFALDLTYPTVSYTTGHEFNRGIFKTFGNSQIEDFWLTFYCNTTNLSKSRAEIHTSGYAWRYIRASMTLAGLLPPLCDEGHMLVDGGYVDNLTVAHMRSLGADVIFAVDVGSLDDDTPQSFDDSLSGFYAVFQRWNPFSSVPAPPTLSEIQARLAYVSSVDALERAKTMPGCLYMRPPIDAYATLDFAKFDEIFEVGYAYAKEFLAGLKANGDLDGVAGVGSWTGDGSPKGEGMRRTMAPRRASI